MNVDRNYFKFFLTLLDIHRGEWFIIWKIKW